ncbi:hypothetical protein [Georgenia sp. SYP-B2076]|uniref:AMIN-like domain-containing (lipo)protein n=1 Tax=Georgenia sp. SYP-B2076 TaxID=2495881 RepID=UPI0013DFE6AB|nr:hypothetical protein [Georgenia sp. SYP-B2076]
MKTSTRVATAITAGLVLTLAACGSEPATDTSPSVPSTSAASEPATGSATETTAGEGSTGEATAAPAQESDEPGADVAFTVDPQQSPAFPGGGGDLLPVDVRAGTHPGYERVVFDLEGADTPQWRVEYVDSAISEGKGDEIDVAGDATLQVITTGFRMPEPSETGKLAQGAYAPGGTDLVKEVFVSGIFEGQNQAFIGLDAQAPFRVFTLSDPARIVVDVQTGS